ncbi:MAG: hypothetical protein WBF71_02805 [Microthrixaceae bacterium]
MTHLLVQHGELIVRLNLVEQLMALRRGVRVSLDSIKKVSVLSKPISSFPGPMIDVHMGLAASSAPLAHLATIGPRATYRDGAALVVVWKDRPSVAIELHPTAGRWRLIVASVREPQAVAGQIVAALR